MTLPTAVVALVLSASSGPAQPSAWTTTFAASTATQRFGAESVAIVAAGPAAEAASAALAEALRRAPSRPQVRLMGRIGKAASMSDTQLVDAAKGTGARRTAVVRVYPGADGAKQVCTVTVYGNDGVGEGSFNAMEGETPRSAVKTGVEVAVDEISTFHKVDAAFVRANWLAFDEEISYGGSEHFPLRGEDKARISWEDFYRQVGRKDLAGDVGGRSVLRMALFTGTFLGFTASMVGALAMVVGAVNNGGPQALSTAPLWIPGLGVVGSLGLLVLGATIAPLPVDMPENRRLGDAYNDRLRRGEAQPTAGRRIGAALTLAL